jgi:hypothetical protein
MGGFRGLGGQITFGKNPNGSGFMNFQFGFGLGGGFEFDPLGSQPGYTPDQCDHWGLGLGVYGQGSLNLGSVYVGAGIHKGVNSARGEYKDPNMGAGLKGGKKGIGVSANGGVEVTIYGGGKSR